MRHQALNDLIARSFSAADVPVTIGVTPFRREAPWWSFTGPMAKWQSSLLGCDCHLSFGGLVHLRCCPWTRVGSRTRCTPQGFVPIAFENLGVPNASAKLLLTHLGRRLSEKSRECRETFLFKRCSVLLQRFNAFTWKYARLWPHGILDIPSLFIFTNFFKPFSGTLIPRVKIIIIIIARQFVRRRNAAGVSTISALIRRN